MPPRVTRRCLCAALLFSCASSHGAESRDHSFVVTLPAGWRMVDPAKFEGDVVFAAIVKKHPEETLLVSRIALAAGSKIKDFAASKFQTIKAKSRFSPSPSPLRAVELRKGMPPAWAFRAGDPIHRFEIAYFHFGDADYSSVCPAERDRECRAILGTMTPGTRSVWHRPVVGPFRLQIPPGWDVIQDSSGNFEFGRPPGQSLLLRAIDVPESVATAPTIEGDLQRSLTALAPKAKLSRLRTFTFLGGRGKAVWVVSDRGAEGSMLSGVVWASGRSYRLAVVSRVPAEPLARQALNTWSPAP